MDEELYESLMLDNGSNIDMLANKEYSNGEIWDIDPIRVGTNGGNFQMKQATELINYGEVQYSKDLLANVRKTPNCAIQSLDMSAFSSPNICCFLSVWIKVPID